MKRILLFFVFLQIFIAGSAGAACRWEWLCDAAGNCVHKPVCDSPLDIPPPEPPSVPPVPPPSVRPIQSPTIPPVGTHKCRDVRRCDSQGKCIWQTVCQ